MAMAGIGQIGQVIGSIASGIISGVGEGIGEGIGKGVSGLITSAAKKFDDYKNEKEENENEEDCCEMSDEARESCGAGHANGAGGPSINLIGSAAGGCPANGGGGTTINIGGDAGRSLPDLGWLGGGGRF